MGSQRRYTQAPVVCNWNVTPFYWKDDSESYFKQPNIWSLKLLYGPLPTLFSPSRSLSATNENRLLPLLPLLLLRPPPSLSSTHPKCPTIIQAIVFHPPGSSGSPGLPLHVNLPVTHPGIQRDSLRFRGPIRIRAGAVNMMITLFLLKTINTEGPTPLEGRKYLLTAKKKCWGQ